MENIELCFDYEGQKYASIPVDEENVEIVRVESTSEGISLIEIKDENLYEKLKEEYKKYDLEEDE